MLRAGFQDGWTGRSQNSSACAGGLLSLYVQTRAPQCRAVVHPDANVLRRAGCADDDKDQASERISAGAGVLRRELDEDACPLRMARQPQDGTGVSVQASRFADEAVTTLLTGHLHKRRLGAREQERKSLSAASGE